MSGQPEPLACALVLLLAFSTAGIAHVLWLRSPRSVPFALALDGGWRWRGRRLFGPNKTLRGFLALVPATAAVFGMLGAAREALPGWLAAGLWPLSTAQLFLLGAWAAFWFMAGELPNSFLKRQWDIAPGEVPAFGLRRWLCLALDRVDSIVAMLLAVALVVPLPALTALVVLTVGAGVHLFFSSLLYFAQVKRRLA
jgi:CDP-archaeol synthase